MVKNAVKVPNRPSKAYTHHKYRHAKVMPANKPSSKRNKKSQTAIEFLSTYTWAFILIAIVIAIVVALSLTRSPTTYSITHCFIQPELPCEGFIIMSNGTGSRAVLAFLNNLGSNITLPSNAFVVQEPLSSTVFHGQCLPAKGPEGSLIICNATMDGYAPSVGTQLSPTFSVSYSSCANGCNSAQLNSSGSSTLFVSPSENLTDRITLLTSTGTGFVVLGGTAYPSNTVVAIIKGLSYPLYASPPNGYAFSTWTSSTGIAFEYPSQSTNITDQNIGTTGHIEANFNKVITTSTTTISTIITGSPTNPISNPVSNPISNPASNGVSNTASGAATNSPSGGATNSPSGGATNSPSSSASGVSSSSSSSRSTNGASRSTNGASRSTNGASSATSACGGCICGCGPCPSGDFAECGIYGNGQECGGAGSASNPLSNCVPWSGASDSDSGDACGVPC